jgi:hypothetical protein
MGRDLLAVPICTRRRSEEMGRTPLNAEGICRIGMGIGKGGTGAIYVVPTFIARSRPMNVVAIVVTRPRKMNSGSFLPQALNAGFISRTQMCTGIYLVQSGPMCRLERKSTQQYQS